MDENYADYGLLISFPDGSPSFVYGFEAGQISARMQSGSEAEFSVTTRIENREVIQRLADNLGWSAIVTATDVEGWDETVFAKTRAARERPNARGLRLVETDHG